MNELSTPCMSTAVDGAARGVLIGIAWGAVFDIPPLGFVSNITPAKGSDPLIVSDMGSHQRLNFKGSEESASLPWLYFPFGARSHKRSFIRAS